jgi:hypothetical protein
MTKLFIFTVLAVLAGIYAYSVLSKKNATNPNALTDADKQKLDAMFGPGNAFSNTDPMTGAVKVIGNQPGTVEFSGQDN